MRTKILEICTEPSMNTWNAIKAEKGELLVDSRCILHRLRSRMSGTGCTVVSDVGYIGGS